MAPHKESFVNLELPLNGSSMAKELILVRHAKSSWSPYSKNTFVGDDHSRPLNFRGEIAAKSIASHLSSEVGIVDKVFSSSARRAVQTADTIVSHVTSVHKNVVASELYTFEAEKLRNYVRKINNELEKIIIVGHNPAMQELCKYLANPNNFSRHYKNLEKKYPTCGVAVIKLRCKNWNDLTNNCGNLENFVTPKSISD